MNISFLTSGHYPYDDRIFFHLGKTLTKNGHKVEITSSKTTLNEVTKGISVNCFDGDNLAKGDKIKYFRERLDNFCPDLIICSEPLPILAAKQYKRKSRKKVIIIYDITEWYPSARFLKEYSTKLKWLGFLKLLFFNVYASYFADAFIFGESYKSKPYRLFFPFTPFKIITYYPDLKYVSYKAPSFSGKKLRLSFSGEISIEKGFRNFLNVVYGLSERNRDLEIEVKMAAWYGSENDRIECESLIRNDIENITFYFAGKQNFKDFTGTINETDIFLDLRKINFENNNSLPIKLFYYAALGRPVIFSDLKAVRRDVEIEKFGFLVKPENTEKIISIISHYLKSTELYNEHCINARREAEEKYNWRKITPDFLSFIESF